MTKNDILSMDKEMTNDERWDAFIVVLRAYIEEHHLCPLKHTDLYNRTRYYRRKMKEGSLPPKKENELEEILKMRNFSEHTGRTQEEIIIQ